MLLQKYLQTINGIDPGKIYVENVRSLHKLSRFSARLICELAVQEKLFVKKYGLVCPSCDRIIDEFDSYDQIPIEINCHICEIEEKEVSKYRTSEIKIEEYYRLAK